MTRRAARRRVPRDVLVERVIVGGFALIYLAAIVGIAVSVRGIGY
jgi:hypothetical protein